MPSTGFVGTDYEVAVYKQRFMLPTQFQRKLNPAAKKTFVLTCGDDNTIACYPLDNWNILIDRLENGSDDDQNDLTKLYFYASEQELEGPGRLKISNDLMEYAHIQDKVKIIGEGTLITLIAPELLAIKRKKINEIQATRTSRRKYRI